MVLTAWAAVPIPILDSIDITYSYLTGGFTWSWLLTPHNEHIIVIPRLLVIADLALTNGQMLIFVGLSLLSWSAVFLLIARHIKHAVSNHDLRMFVIALLAILFFRAFFLQCVVLNAGFNYPLTAIFAVVAFVLAAGLQPSRAGYLSATASALAGLASGFCLINGLLAIPLAGALACIRSRSPLTLLPFVVALGVGAACYLGAEVSAPRVFEFEPLLWIQALTGMFGAPWAHITGGIGQAAGGVVLLLAGGSLLSATRDLRNLDPLTGLGVTLILFGLGSAGMIVLGRPNEVDFMAVAGRYGLWVALVHAGILLIVVRMPLAQRLHHHPVVKAIALVGAGVLLAEQAVIGDFYVTRSQGMDVAVAQIRSGDRSDAALDAVKSNMASSRPAFDFYALKGLYGFR